jgi:hypothetical protein
MCDHAAIRGDHLTDLDELATTMRNVRYEDETAAYELSKRLDRLGYGPEAECLPAARIIVSNAKIPREEPKAIKQEEETYEGDNPMPSCCPVMGDSMRGDLVGK